MWLNSVECLQFQLSINQEHISDSIPSATSHENNSNINNLINDIVANDDNLVNENFMNSTPEVNQLMKEEGELSSTIMHDSTTGALEEHYVRKVVCGDYCADWGLWQWCSPSCWNITFVRSSW